MLEGADECVLEERPVAEVGLADRHATAPAADEMGHGVDSAEPLEHPLRPGPGGCLVEQVDDVHREAVRLEGELESQRLERFEVPAGQRQSPSVRRESSRDGAAGAARGAGDHRGPHAATAWASDSSLRLSDV